MSSPIPGSSDHDPELARFFDAVVDLSARRLGSGPDPFLAEVEALAQQFRALAKYRTDKSLGQRLEAFAAKRFDLVDDPSEHALAWAELEVLALTLGESTSLLLPALKRAIERMTSHLSEEGVAVLFGQMLKRTRQLAKQHGDVELERWIWGVVNALP